MSETTHNEKALFAIEAKPSVMDLSENVAIYRRLKVRDKAAAAAELRRRIQIDIAEQRQRQPEPPRGKSRVSRVKASVLAFVRSVCSAVDHLASERVVHSVHVADNYCE